MGVQLFLDLDSESGSVKVPIPIPSSLWSCSSTSLSGSRHTCWPDKLCSPAEHLQRRLRRGRVFHCSGFRFWHLCWYSALRPNLDRTVGFLCLRSTSIGQADSGHQLTLPVRSHSFHHLRDHMSSVQPSLPLSILRIRVDLLPTLHLPNRDQPRMCSAHIPRVAP